MLCFSSTQKVILPFKTICLAANSIPDKRVHDHMSELIDIYFMKHLNLDQSEAFRLHQEYYKNYGLAIEGLVRHHQIDPLEYNRQVDDALPLEDILSPDPELRKLIQDIDTSKVKLWLFTNAYVNHGKRVVKILGIEDLFEGMTYCDYNANPLLCKPSGGMFRKAMREAGIENMDQCYFVDDSKLNVTAAQKLGWHAVRLLEPADDSQPAVTREKPDVISNLMELKDVFPQFFKSKQ